MGIGRPSTYKPEYCEAIVEYFEKMAGMAPRDGVTVVIELTETGQPAPQPELTISESGGIALTSAKTPKGKGYLKREVRQICAELPTLQGFAISIETPKSTLLGWVKDNDDFAEAVERCKDIQYRLLIERGRTRQYDPMAFAFVAKNLTDMTDRKEITGAGGAPLQATLILVDAGSQDLLDMTTEDGTTEDVTVYARRVPLLPSDI